MSESAVLLPESLDELAKKVFREAGECLGTAVSNLINILNPDMVVIGGGVSKSRDILMDPVRETVDKLTMAIPRKSVSIVTETVFEDAGVIGAAGLVLHELYEPPEIEKLMEDY